MNKLPTNNLYLSLLFLLYTSIAFTQENEDFETWYSLEFEYKLDEKWGFSLEEQLRLKDNSSVINGYFTQLNTAYKISKDFEIGGAVRYIKKNDTKGKIQGYEDHLRFHIDGSYKHNINRFYLKYRLRYQNRNELGVSSAEDDYPNQYVRLKASLKYKINNWKLDPKFSAEIFNHFQHGEENGLNNLRLTLSTDYKFKKAGKIRLFFRTEKELNTTDPKTTNIVGVKYAYTLKNKSLK